MRCGVARIPYLIRLQVVRGGRLFGSWPTTRQTLLEQLSGLPAEARFFFGSSVETVGERWLGQFSKCVI
jgi:hypothetical protein